MTEAAEYWERKILTWEEARYSRAHNPMSWTVRARLHQAEKIIRERTAFSTRILELGCGSGLLAARLRGHSERFFGLDIAQNAILRAVNRVPQFSFAVGDVLTATFPRADLTVFLGLTDWLDESGMDTLFSKVSSRSILFSYTHASPWSPYRLYRLYADRPNTQRARGWTRHHIYELLDRNGYRGETLVQPYLLNPGALVWAKKK